MTVGVVHIEAPIARVVGMEGEPQQSAFTAIAHAVREIEERFAQEHSILDDPDTAGLLDDEDASVPWSAGREHRVIEPFGDARELQAMDRFEPIRSVR